MDYLFGNGMLKKPNKYNIHERNVMQFDKICFVAATITLKPSLPHRSSAENWSLATYLITVEGERI